MLFDVRKIVTLTEEIRSDYGPVPDKPLLKGAIAAVVSNPYVGEYVEDLAPASEELEALGEMLGGQLIDHLGNDPRRHRKLWQGCDRRKCGRDRTRRHVAHTRWWRHENCHRPGRVDRALDEEGRPDGLSARRSVDASGLVVRG